MKYIIILVCLMSYNAYSDCKHSTNEETTDVVHKVDTSMPAYLKGAKITITLANGTTSTVTSEKFMVVPRLQTTVLGQNKAFFSRLVCTEKVDDSKKNIVSLDVRKDVTELEIATIGNTTNVNSKKELVPGINYYRRKVLGPVGFGAGIDTNGTPKAAAGYEF